MRVRVKSHIRNGHRVKAHTRIVRHHAAPRRRTRRKAR